MTRCKAVGCQGWGLGSVCSEIRIQWLNINPVFGSIVSDCIWGHRKGWWYTFLSFRWGGGIFWVRVEGWDRCRRGLGRGLSRGIVGGVSRGWGKEWVVCGRTIFVNRGGRDVCWWDFLNSACLKNLG